MDVQQIIKSFGYLGMFLIVFSESGLLVGFFLPGDSLLFAAGFLASQGALNIYFLLVLLIIAAVAGVQSGYHLGRRYGPRLFSRTDSLLFNQHHIERSKRFFDKHGGKTIILARFTPIVRSVAPLIAGAGDMHYKTFAVYNVIGAILWVSVITLSGYFFGNLIPNIEAYLIPAIVLIMLIVMIPSLAHLFNAYRKAKKDIKASDLPE
jgi:membrane-associated protein